MRIEGHKRRKVLRPPPPNPWGGRGGGPSSRISLPYIFEHQFMVFSRSTKCLWLTSKINPKPYYLNFSGNFDPNPAPEAHPERSTPSTKRLTPWFGQNRHQFTSHWARKILEQIPFKPQKNKQVLKNRYLVDAWFLGYFSRPSRHPTLYSNKRRAASSPPKDTAQKQRIDPVPRLHLGKAGRVTGSDAANSFLQ